MEWTEIATLVATIVVPGGIAALGGPWLWRTIKAQGEASEARDQALHEAIEAQGQASLERDQAGRDRDHSIEKRIDDLRAGNRGPGYGGAPTGSVIVARR